MNHFTEYAERFFFVILPKLLVFFVFLAIASFFGWVFPKPLRTFLKEFRVRLALRHMVTTITRVVIIAVGIIVAFEAIGLDITLTAAFAIAISVLISSAAGPTLSNMMGAFIIQGDPDTQIGDKVSVRGYEGVIISQTLFKTTLWIEGGKWVKFPNNEFNVSIIEGTGGESGEVIRRLTERAAEKRGRGTQRILENPGKPKFLQGNDDMDDPSAYDLSESIGGQGTTTDKKD